MYGGVVPIFTSFCTLIMPYSIWYDHGYLMSTVESRPWQLTSFIFIIDQLPTGFDAHVTGYLLVAGVNETHPGLEEGGFAGLPGCMKYPVKLG